MPVDLESSSEAMAAAIKASSDIDRTLHLQKAFMMYIFEEISQHDPNMKKFTPLILASAFAMAMGDSLRAGHLPPIILLNLIEMATLSYTRGDDEDG